MRDSGGYDFGKQRDSREIPHIPAIDRNIEAIIRGMERRPPLQSAYPIVLTPPPAEQKPAQKAKLVPLVGDYVPPHRKRWDEDDLCGMLTPQFSAPVHYEGLLESAERLEKKRKAVPAEDQLAYTRSILNELHPVSALFRDLQKLILEHKPTYDRFLPEVTIALQRITPCVNRNYAIYNALKTDINKARGHGNH